MVFPFGPGVPGTASEGGDRDVITGIGALPHPDARAAAVFSFEACPDLPFVPEVALAGAACTTSRSLVQAMVGIRGVTLDAENRVCVDAERLHPLAKVVPDLEHPSFAGLRALLAEAGQRNYDGPVKWQFTGPLTLSLALIREGVPARTAFDVAIRTVRVSTRAIYRAIAEVLPTSRQTVLLDEPDACALLDSGLPVSLDAAIDLVSGALAALEQYADVGVHCCGNGDLSAILAAGPSLISVPLSGFAERDAGSLAKFLDLDGKIVWGAVPVDRPLGSVDRYWRELLNVWLMLEATGVDRDRLRTQSIISPVCGLVTHNEAQVAAIFEICRELSARLDGSVGSIGRGLRAN
jgi:hypothetical protein